MARDLIWTLSACKDLQNLVDGLARDSSNYAMSFYENVTGKAETIKEFPYRGQLVPELNDSNIREVFVHKYHRLIYLVDEHSIVILTVV